MTAILLCTAALTGACETRCDLVHLGAHACHGIEGSHTPNVRHASTANMPGMQMFGQSHVRQDEASHVLVAQLGSPACTHVGCIEPAALLAPRQVWPGPPVVADVLLDVQRLTPWQAVEPVTVLSHRAVPDRSAETPVSQRTTLRV